MRTNNTLPLSAFMELGSLGHAKTRAAWPVWSSSTSAPTRFAPMPKKKLARLYHQARAWNRQRIAGRYGGALGSAALRVLESLIFDFLNFATGRLDPSYEALARRTGLSRATVATALARLKSLGIVSWLRRCTASHDADGRFALRQSTNAYAVLPPSQWIGYAAPAEPPPPDPAAWGAAPVFPAVLERHRQMQADGLTRATLLELVAQEARQDPLMAALASFGRTLQGR